ncbi:hypothetical protein ACJRO7_018040 [Eucalyptus globulus]|uniref:RNase H type-1 domain-containing protein n=1 Tax=Eucalyptus globulus TaxID=34317 RepID=A0ABD3KTY3_EUCGL
MEHPEYKNDPGTNAVEGSLKFNVDGSFIEGSTDGAIAGICRDHKVNIITGFAKLVKASLAAQVETLAIREALQFSKHSKVSHEVICVESDRLDLDKHFDKQDDR